MEAEPDPRNTLANERTMLAWIRTALGLLASGVALLALTVPVSDQLRFPAALLLIAAGIGAAWYSWRGWARTQHALRQRAPLPAPRFGLFISLLVGCAGVLVLAGLVVHAAST